MIRTISRAIQNFIMNFKSRARETNIGCKFQNKHSYSCLFCLSLFMFVRSCLIVFFVIFVFNLFMFVFFFLSFFFLPVVETIGSGVKEPVKTAKGSPIGQSE